MAEFCFICNDYRNIHYRNGSYDSLKVKITQIHYSPRLPPPQMVQTLLPRRMSVCYAAQIIEAIDAATPSMTHSVSIFELAMVEYVDIPYSTLPPSELISTRMQEGRMTFSKKSNSSLKRDVFSSVTLPKNRIVAGASALTSPTTY